MANKETMKTNTELESLRNRSSTLVYGMPEQLSDENKELSSIVQQSIIDVKVKLGSRTNNKPIRYFNEINYGSAFSTLFVNKEERKDKVSEEENKRKFKRYMAENPNISIDTLLQEDYNKFTVYQNYRIIKEHIPECSRALKIYKDNIISPDDFTKLIFNVKYDKEVDEEQQNIIQDQLKDLNIKYELEDKVDEIIDEALTLGEADYAVLSLEDEMNILLNESIKKGQTLTEAFNNIKLADTNTVTSTILSESINLSEEDLMSLNELFADELNGNTLLESKAKEFIADCVNKNIQIGSAKEYLLEKASAEADFHKSETDISDDFYKTKSKKDDKKKDDKKPLYLNGSVIRRLKPENLVDLTIDGTCYGYYYAEDLHTKVAFGSYIGTPSGRDLQTSVNIAQNNTISTTTGTPMMQDGSSPAAKLGVGNQKLKVITDLFINQIANKIDKDFIRKNKQFKDFIYDLLRQDYIIKKGIKLTYFRPDEVVKFELTPLYKDITFFAKLYLAILSNTIIIKMGRAHDKRIFYINVGADAQYEQAIQSVIEDIKTKDYKMDSLNDFNTILQLAPGRFDDYYMPSINGEHPIDIETIQGMDVEMNNEFIDYLKNSMMSGMDVPRNLIDVTSDVDYARSISSMNANFVRSVVKAQKRLTAPFTRFYQMLYKNEYKYSNDGENEDLKIVDINAIQVQFPSPATLNMTKMSEELTQCDANADAIARTIIIPKMDQSNEPEILRLKSKILRDSLPNVDWDKYEKFAEDAKMEIEKEKIEEKAYGNQNPEMDPYAGQY